MWNQLQIRKVNCDANYNLSFIQSLKKCLQEHRVKVSNNLGLLVGLQHPEDHYKLHSSPERWTENRHQQQVEEPVAGFIAFEETRKTHVRCHRQSVSLGAKLARSGSGISYVSQTPWFLLMGPRSGRQARWLLLCSLALSIRKTTS